MEHLEREGGWKRSWKEGRHNKETATRAAIQDSVMGSQEFTRGGVLHADAKHIAANYHVSH